MRTDPKFLRRFDQVWSALRRHQFLLGSAATLAVAAIGFGLLSGADFRFELPRPVRAAAVAAIGALALSALVVWVVLPLRWWTKPRTAVEIEGRFPQLGQRIRTVVQYAGLRDDAILSEGVTPGLVSALNDETESQVEPLPLASIIPHRRTWAVAALAAAPLAFLSIAAIRSDEWRIAMQRSALIERPYTTLAVRPGSVLVEQGDALNIAVDMKGRMRPRVVLESRPAGSPSAEWKPTRLDAPENSPKTRRETAVAKIQDPFEYRVVAGPARSGTFQVDVRYPLVVKDLSVTVTPPEYTGLEPSTTKGGNVQAVEGSGAKFAIAFDAVPVEAALEMTDPAAKSKDKGETKPTIVPLTREGDTFTTSMTLSKDLDYKIVARTADERRMPKNKHRIDVREDRAPRVSFEEPEEALEVHPIAEVRKRVRVGDDFGVTKAGIVFRFNDGEEKTLVAKAMPTEKGKKPQTAATLEETLLMETLAASPQDSVTYYAFAEDNFPGGPRRTETDLRYIDIRPFKRDYKLADPAAGIPGEPDELATLEELIARQRFNLNRANRLAKHKAKDKVEAEDPLKVAGFEETLLGMTREFTEGIERLADERVESMHRAESAMVAAVEALDRSRNAEAPVAMAEAQKNLVAARRELLFLIGQKPMAAQAMRSFDRKQAQKIRKPKNKDEEAEQIAEELEALAQDEEFVYATLVAGEEGENGKSTKGQAGEEEAQEEPKKDAEPRNNAETKRDAAAKQEGDPKDGDTRKDGEPKDAQAKGGKGQKGPKGKQGPKGAKGSGEEQGEDGDGGKPRPFDRRAVGEKQEEIADEARALEEKLKRIEAASDLAKARMAKAAESAEKASGDLVRGNSKGAADEAKKGAGMLHELARQVKGEIAREVADELAMARDLAEELADREAEFADENGAEGDAKGTGDTPGQGDGDKPGKGKGTKPGKGRGGRGASGVLDQTDAERIEQMAEMARTLEGWLRGIDGRDQGKAADAAKEILDGGAIAEIVERTERLGELRVGGKRPEAGKEARELSGKLERIAQALELVHRGIVAPQLAAMVEFDRRVAALTTRLATLRTDAQITAWHREASALIRDLDKAGIAGAAELADALREGGWNGTAGAWNWGGGPDSRLAPGGYANVLSKISSQIKDNIQEMVLKDLASSKDEATPPKYKELVERYYEVLSRGVAEK